MAKIVHFADDFYDSGDVKFAAGSYHPLNSETQSLVVAGFAELIDSDDVANHAPVLQALADMAHARAATAASQAEALAAEAEQAQQLADEAHKSSDKSEKDTPVV